MQIVSSEDILHEMPKPVFLEKSEKIFHIVICWNFYPACSAFKHTN